MDVGSFLGPLPRVRGILRQKQGPPPQLAGTAPPTNPGSPIPSSSACWEKACPRSNPPALSRDSYPSSSLPITCAARSPGPGSSPGRSLPQPQLLKAGPGSNHQVHPAPSRLVSSLVRHSTAPSASQSNKAWGRERGRKTLRLRRHIENRQARRASRLKITVPQNTRFSTFNSKTLLPHGTQAPTELFSRRNLGGPQELAAVQ